MGGWNEKKNIWRIDREDSSQKMKIDFFIAKSKITSKHNITPIEFATILCIAAVVATIGCLF